MRIILFCMAAIIILSISGWAAAKASGQRVYASRATGTVTRNSEPRAGMIVTRRVSSWDYDKVQETRTDRDGVFRFPELTERRGLTDFLPLPGEIRVIQSIHVEDEGGEKSEIWSTYKRDFERNSELGHPIELLCDLGDEKRNEVRLPKRTKVPKRNLRQRAGSYRPKERVRT